MVFQLTKYLMKISPEINKQKALNFSCLLSILTNVFLNFILFYSNKNLLALLSL